MRPIKRTMLPRLVMERESLSLQNIYAAVLVRLVLTNVT